jgi:accessory colonization factor AcfC
MAAFPVHGENTLDLMAMVRLIVSSYSVAHCIVLFVRVSIIFESADAEMYLVIENAFSPFSCSRVRPLLLSRTRIMTRAANLELQAPVRL